MTLLNGSIRDFLADRNVVGNLLLPTHYPEFGRLDHFQVGLPIWRCLRKGAESYVRLWPNAPRQASE